MRTKITAVKASIGSVICSLFAVFAVALGLSVVPVRAETVNCTSVNDPTVFPPPPLTITAPGVYCLTDNIVTNLTGAVAAITIASDNVVLDLNGFAIDNRAAGMGTQASGIGAADHSDLVIKNGKVEGFFYGISLTASGDTSQGNVVEDIRAYYNTYRGINLEFGVHRGAIVRNNLVLNTGGSIVPGRTTTNGILVAGGGAAVLNNKVTNTNDTTTSNTGIRVFGGDNVIVNNRVAEVTAVGPVGGIGINGGSPAVSKCSHNLTIGAAAGIINCTLVGNDNS